MLLCELLLLLTLLLLLPLCCCCCQVRRDKWKCLCVHCSHCSDKYLHNSSHTAPSAFSPSLSLSMLLSICLSAAPLPAFLAALPLCTFLASHCGFCPRFTWFAHSLLVFFPLLSLLYLRPVSPSLCCWSLVYCLRPLISAASHYIKCIPHIHITCCFCKSLIISMHLPLSLSHVCLCLVSLFVVAR